MKIAVFCSNYPPHPGGLEAVVHNIARGLAERHDVAVISTAWEGRRDRSREDGLDVIRMPAIHRSEAWGVPWPLPFAGVESAWAAVADADLIHAHGALYATSVLAARRARSLRVPFVLTEHVGFVPYRRASLNRIQHLAWKSVGRYVLGAASAVTVYNARVEAWFDREYPGVPLHFIGNGVDHERFRPHDPAERAALRRQFGLPADDTVALFVGRQAEKKNLDSVLRIPRSGFTLAVCGAARTLAADRIVDLGVVPHESMAAIYGAADLMIHASTGEGFPLAVQEAMASGLPIAILWDEGYAKSLDPDVVAPARSLDELAELVPGLAMDPEARTALGRRAREWTLEHWRWANTVDQYDQLFADLAGSARSSDGKVRT